MNACNLSLSGMDVGACIGQLFSGFVPEWVWPLLPYWPWFAILAILGLSYRIAGLPGLTAAAGAIGYILGRRSVTPEPHEHVSGKDAAPSSRTGTSKTKPVKSSRTGTLVDILKGLWKK